MLPGAESFGGGGHVSAAGFEYSGVRWKYCLSEGQNYYYLEEYDKAQALLSASADSLDLEGRLLLGEIYLAMDDTDHARMTYQSCIEEYGETPQCVNGLVLCDIADGDYASALENADRGLALDGEREESRIWPTTPLWPWSTRRFRRSLRACRVLCGAVSGG